MDYSEFFPIEKNVYLFYCSVKKMEYNGYDVFHFQAIIDEIENILDNYEKGIIIEFSLSLNDLINYIKTITENLFKVSATLLKKQGIEYMSYVVKNNTTSVIKLVYFCSSEISISSTDLESITNSIKPIMLILTGNENSSPNSFFSVELILKMEPKPNPKKKILEMSNYSYTLQDYLLLLPYNNVMQGQYKIMPKKEVSSLLSKVKNKKEFPSVSLENDQFLNYSELEESSKEKLTILKGYGLGPSNLIAPLSLEYRLVTK